MGHTWRHNRGGYWLSGRRLCWHCGNGLGGKRGVAGRSCLRSYRVPDRKPYRPALMRIISFCTYLRRPLSRSKGSAIKAKGPVGLLRPAPLLTGYPAASLGKVEASPRPRSPRDDPPRVFYSSSSVFFWNLRRSCCPFLKVPGNARSNFSMNSSLSSQTFIKFVATATCFSRCGCPIFSVRY